MFELEALNAKFGDALLLHWGTAKPRLAVIDAGPRGVFKSTVRPRLEQLMAHRGGPPLVVDLVMVSHIDEDHIAGIVDLFKYLEKVKEDGDALPFNVLALWHNSFRDAVHAAKIVPTSLSPGVTVAGLEVGTLPPDVLGEVEPGTQVDLASVKQGDDVRRIATALAVALNQPFPNGLIMAAAGAPKKVTIDGLTLTVVGPSAERLEALRQEWATKQEGKTPSPAEVAEYLEKTVSNLSSLVFLAESGDGRMLLTGDARGDDILAGLESAKLLAKGGGTMKVDVLKVPHHGSSRNLAIDFFQRILADDYVISADGTYDNPDVETLEMLTEARGSDAYTIWLTNDVAHARDFFERDRAANTRHYQVELPKPGTPFAVAAP
jgi:hypothetical protein